jgi:hypothetical protein
MDCCRLTLLIMLLFTDAVPLASAAEHEKKKQQLQPVPIPSLPAGATFDLSSPELKTPEGITFSLPQNLSVAGTTDAVDVPSQLTSTDWMIIAKNTNMLRGDRMDKANPEHPEDSLGKAPVLLWKVPPDDSFVTSNILTGSVDSRVSYSEATSNFVSCGYDEKAADASYAYCSGSFTRTHEEKHAQSLATKTLYMNGSWYFPAATVDLTKCTTVSPVFEKSVQDALDGKGFSLDPNASGDPDPARDLAAVFHYFGHAVPSRVTIGAQLTFRYSVEAKATFSMNQVKDTIKAAVNAKVDGFGGSASTAFQTATQGQLTAKQLAEKTAFVAIGGQRNLASNPSAWASTTNKWISWAVIRKMEMRPTYDLLNPELKKRVLDLWPKLCPILGPVDLVWQENSGAAVQAETSSFVIATRCDLHDGNRASVEVRSGPNQDLGGNAQSTATGAAFVHYYKRHDDENRANSVCIPVRQNGHYLCRFNASNGSPGGRLLYVTSFLKLQDWISLESPPAADSKDDDGFLFVNIEASEAGGERGAVLAEVDGKVMAGASVHASHSADAFISQECFCVPVAAGAKIEWQIIPTHGNPKVRAYWMPFQKDNVLHMGKREDREVDTTYTAETSGILHGYIEAKSDGERGSLEIYSPDDKRLYAAASVHKYIKSDRWVWCNSVFFPVAKDATYEVHLNKPLGLGGADASHLLDADFAQRTLGRYGTAVS